MSSESRKKLRDIYSTPESKLEKLADNNSGRGQGSVVPDQIKGFSWGAFFLNWIWAIGNKTWIGLLSLIPYFGFIMAFILGFKGREWAWQNKRWESIEHFNHVQKRWSFWGVVIALIVPVIGVIAAIAIPAYQHYVMRTVGG